MRAGTRRRIDKAEHHLALAIQSAFIDYIAVRIRDELPLADLLEPEAFGPCLALASFGITAIGISPPKISADRMVGRRLELRVDRDHSKSRLPAEVPPLPGNAFPNQEKGDRGLARPGGYGGGPRKPASAGSPTHPGRARSRPAGLTHHRERSYCDDRWQ